PPLPSLTAAAREAPPGANPAAVAAGPREVEDPVAPYSSRAGDDELPGEGDVDGEDTAVGVGRAVAPGLGDDAVAGGYPAVLTTAPSGANSTLEPPATAPRSASWSAGGGAAAGAGGGVGAVPNEICSGLAAVAPEAATSPGLTIVTDDRDLPARWGSRVMPRPLPLQGLLTCAA